MRLGAEWTDVLQSGIQTAGSIFGAPQPSYKTPTFTAPTTSGAIYQAPTLQQQIDSVLGLRAPAVAAPAIGTYQPPTAGAFGINPTLLVLAGLGILVVVMMRRGK